MWPSPKEALELVNTLVRFHQDGHSNETLAFVVLHEREHARAKYNAALDIIVNETFDEDKFTATVSCKELRCPCGAAWDATGEDGRCSECGQPVIDLEVHNVGC